ncbi:uncharacterized protein LOC130690492 [Daphnia carinata]|uniref:uncharacterized protein LOC130690492 n=1 Tax=Daphnia carinata TaxID=120202 RepID=UPI00257FF81B|nr:uncharacterized protein LOC130690492 [Daphnia carinata]
MKFKCPWIKKRLIAVILVLMAVGGSSESGRRNSTITVKQLSNDSTTTEASSPLALVAAESLQVQRQAFLSVILSYLARPEENPADGDALEGRDVQDTNEQDQVRDENNNLTAGQSWSRFADSHIHLRVLRSTSEPEARALFSRSRTAHPSSGINRHNPRRQFQFNPNVQRPSSTAVSVPPSDRTAELAELLRENLLRQRRRNQLIDGEAEETSATIEVVQTRTPFVIRNGEMIMNDLPMVERRSIPQFGGMVILYTRASPLRLLYYGNWCGSGGMGPALDSIDQCCMTHDQCYGDVEQLPCKVIFQKPYTVHYAWRWVEERKQAYCLRTGDRCADMTCECDRIAAACFAKHMINAKLKGNRLRKHRNRVKHPILRGQ